MIRIQLSPSRRNKLVALHKAILSAPYSPKTRLDEAIKETKPKSATRVFLKRIKKRLSLILFGNPLELHAVILELEPLHTMAKVEGAKQLKKMLLSVFDYKKFRNEKTFYGAYTLASFLNVNVCPYCNRISIVTLRTKEGSTRPQLDHWKQNAKYPYLAISLFNLIPSCGPCNGGFKKCKEFDYEDYIHPYIEGYETEYKFQFELKKLDDKVESERDFSISIEPIAGIDEDLKKKGGNTIKALGIKKLYNKHKNIAFDILRKKPLFSAAYIEDQLKRTDPKTGRKLFSSKTDYIEVVCEIKKIKDYRSFAYSKFRRDLSEDLGLEMGDK